jgi:superfamily II DNA helicase RecQ
MRNRLSAPAKHEKANRASRFLVPMRTDYGWRSRPNAWRWREQGVPPYVIFHDSTLLEMHEQRPGSLTEMGRISGVGQGKLTRYGDDFLKVIEDIANR